MPDLQARESALKVSLEIVQTLIFALNQKL
jgi:hypothetical protein